MSFVLVSYNTTPEGASDRVVTGFPIDASEINDGYAVRSDEFGRVVAVGLYSEGLCIETWKRDSGDRLPEWIDIPLKQVERRLKKLNRLGLFSSPLKRKRAVEDENKTQKRHKPLSEINTLE
jgi:hypothetical protein